MDFEMATSSKSLSSVQLGDRYVVSQTSNLVFYANGHKSH